MAGLLLPALASAQYSSGPEDFKPLTDPDGELVFNHTADPGDPGDSCDAIHYPDLATRAFRDVDGRVQLMISHTTSVDQSGTTGGTRRMYNLAGDLRTLTNDCTRLFSADHVFDPASNNNDEWLAAPYTLDGQTIHSLMYDEYQPWDDTTPPEPGPDLCRTATNASSSGCHYSTYTRGKSTNKGDNYNALAPNPFVAGIPFKYTPSPTALPPGQSQGYADASNIAKGPDGLYYALFLARQTPRGDPANAIQKFGTCVIRTDDLEDETSWETWGDGPDAGTAPGWEGVKFVKPYPQAPPDPQHHVCEPVNHLALPGGQPQPGNPIGMSESLTYNRFLGKWMVIGQSTNNTEGIGHPHTFTGPWDSDLYYSLSKDMVNWEKKRLLMNVPHKFDGCTPQPGEQPGNAVLYSSAIDHNSTTRNYETTGRKFHVYFTRFSNCSGSGNDRDLVRVPIEFRPELAGEKVATLENGDLYHSDTGFDAGTTAGGAFEIKNGGTLQAYDGNYYAQATYLTGAGSVSGHLDVNWERGDDVWYGAAFWIPEGFNEPSVNHTGASIMHWENANGSRVGGLFLRSDGQWELRRGTSETTPISNPFTLPENQWFYLEVHQRLNQGPAPRLNQVFVNGEPKSQGTGDNLFPEVNTPAPRRVKFGLPKVSGEGTVVFLDQAYASRMQLGAPGAPPTPEIFSGREGNGWNWLYWNASPATLGYRIYRQTNNGTLLEITTAPHPSANYLHWPLTNCTRYRYVVVAHGANGRSSPATEALELMPRDPAQGCP